MNHVADTPTIAGLSLVSGGAGLDFGVELALAALGYRFRVLGYVEREAYAAATLLARMEDATLEPAPIWCGDLRQFNGRAYRRVVSVLTAGYPCQPFSSAGRRMGEEDERHLWPDVRRVIAQSGASIVFLENVAGHLSLGFGVVRRQLERLGCRVAAGLFTAVEVRAPHRRERVFILGLADSSRGGLGIVGHQAQSWNCGHTDGGSEIVADSADNRRGGGGAPFHDNGCDAPGHDADGCNLHVAYLRGDAQQELQAVERSRGPVVHADGVRRRPQGESSDKAAAALQPGALVADSKRAPRSTEQLDDARGRSDSSTRDGSMPRYCCPPVFPPGPGDVDAWRAILRDYPGLAPAIEPGVRGVDDGHGARADRLRLTGNGVLPLEAAYAFLTLLACLEGDGQHA